MYSPRIEREFEARFAAKYGREITPEEEKYLSLAEIALKDEEPVQGIRLAKKNGAA